MKKSLATVLVLFLWASTIGAQPGEALEGEVRDPENRRSAPAKLAKPASASLTVTYVTNEGFLLESGGKKILIDALVGDNPRYIGLSAETRREVEAGRGRFADIDLVLASHYHRDHFEARAVGAFLESNPKATFVSTPQAVAELESLEAFPHIRARVRKALPDEGSRTRFPELGLEVINLHHGRDRRPVVENLGLIVQVGSFRVLHVGDTEATPKEFAVNGLAEDDIDVAFLADWHLLYEKWAGLVESVIRPRHVAAMHLDPKAGPGHFAALSKAVPGVLLFEQELETRTVSRAASRSQ